MCVPFGSVTTTGFPVAIACFCANEVQSSHIGLSTPMGSLGLSVSNFFLHEKSYTFHQILLYSSDPLLLPF